MDRYYLSKLVDDLNRGAAHVLRSVFGEHLGVCIPLDGEVEVGENHFKPLRFLFSFDEACPVVRILSVREAVSQYCRRYSHDDVSLSFHFGYDPAPLPVGKELRIQLCFILLDWHRDHALNQVRTAALLDDPNNQIRQLPNWLNVADGVNRARLEDEVMGFCQSYLGRADGGLFQVRTFEASFWRIVNLACTWLSLANYEDVVKQMPARFHSHLTDLPQAWNDLRQQEQAYSREAFAVVSRNSLRFARLLLELEGRP